MEVVCDNCGSIEVLAYVQETNIPVCGECLKKFFAGELTLATKEVSANA